MDGSKILLTGGSGKLGTELRHLTDIFISPSSTELDVSSFDSCANFFANNDFDSVLHCAAYTDVKKAELEQIDEAVEINTIGTCNIVYFARKYNKKLIYISTDYVFDGESGNYKATSPINPLSNYAKTKAAGELIVRTYYNSLVIRTSFYGKEFPYDKALIDQFTSKDYVDIIAPLVLREVLSSKIGVVHVGTGRKSVYDLAARRNKNVIAITMASLNFPIPKDTSFDE